MNGPLTPTMLRELEHIERWGEPSDPLEWGNANGLWFRNRERVIDALLARGLLSELGGLLHVTDAGRAALGKAVPA